MTDSEVDLIHIIRTSSDPDKVVEFFLNLFLDYLHTHDQSQESASADLQVSA